MRILRERVLAVIVLFAIIGLPILVFGIGPSVLVSYDSDHRIELSCRVDSAKPSIASSRSLKGAGGSQSQVVFKTDCGTFLLQRGVSRGNMKRIAAEVSAGEEYRFSVGQGSYGLRSALQVFKVAPVAFTYDRVRN